MIFIKKISKDEFETIKQEFKQTFTYARIKRHTQRYALGGFSILPKMQKDIKDYYFTNEQIDELRLWLINRQFDCSGFDIEKDEIYDNDTDGQYKGTKKRHLLFKQGFHFIMKWEYIK
jgi:hypothetical protein